MYRKTGNAFILCVIFLTMLVSMTAGIEKKGEATAPQETLQGDFSAALDKFTFDFLATIVKEDFGENIFVSPLSAVLALTMTYNGASGETKTAMEKALRWDESETERVNEYLELLRRHLDEIDPKVELNIANSIWSRKNLKFKQEFFDTVQKYYDARLEPLTDVATVNKWVSDNTKGKIEKIIDKIDPLDIMVLINALYFKGMWSSKFDSAQTRQRDFFLLDGNSKKHPLMSQSGDFEYFETPDFQAISLPYGDKKLSMYVFLPSKELGLKSFLDRLNAENWRLWINSFREREGEIVLPRFRLEYEKTLNEVLKSMGMEIAFDRSKADFSRMYEISPDENVFISEVKQKTFVEVNEEGTEAAAVTSVKMTLATSVNEEPRKFKMIVDRPFFCAIRDNETGTNLFTGAIVDPE